MSERQPYDDSLKEQLNDLPLPDMEQSWQKMELLLDEDNDRRRLLPPIFLRGCLGWGLLGGALLLLLLWFFFRPDLLWNTEDKNNKQHTSQSPAVRSGTAKEAKPGKDQASPDNTVSTFDTGVDGNTPVSSQPDGTPVLAGDEPLTKPGTTKTGTSDTRPAFNGASESDRQTVTRSSGSGNNSNIAKAGKGKGPVRRSTAGRSGATVGRASMGSRKNSQGNTPGNTASSGVNPVGSQPRGGEDTATRKEPPQDLANTIPQKPDSLKKKPKLPATDTIAKKQQAEKEKEKKKFWFSAGIGLQQQIPFKGQTTTPYNYYGRKGSLADYIPSVYGRIHREQKWFVQGEFRYGAPQAVKELAYDQRSTTDTATTITTTNTLRLKKAYYHQVPLSFNYYVLPNWSVGTGILYSRFRGAVVERELSRRSLQSANDTIISKQVIQVKPNEDSASAFTNSQVHFLFQTEYQWKRFMLGLRYTKGLQPFIRYTDPSGARREEKNESLQLFIRFRLWSSRK
ncbi:MAG TPA: hypothetical protein VFR58_18180 [Flavisolibacter sp.]|nr:hypothetical protein [Flavisolibacter sp.]